MGHYINMLLECGLSMIKAAWSYMGSLPETESHPYKELSLRIHFKWLLSILHHILIIEHSFVVSITYRCGLGFEKALSSRQTQTSSNELFGSQHTATNSLVLMTCHVRKKQK